MTGKWSTDPEVLEKEVVWSFFRGGGPGGQHRNKVETGVRLFHPPSGITVTATEGRSQYRNRVQREMRACRPQFEGNLVLCMCELAN